MMMLRLRKASAVRLREGLLKVVDFIKGDWVRVGDGNISDNGCALILRGGVQFACDHFKTDEQCTFMKKKM